MQLVEEVQETFSSLGWFPPLGAGDAITDQLVLFQRSARGVFPFLPTAMHSVAEGQETASNCGPLGSGGSAALCRDQLVPFQRSALRPLTAVQALAELQETSLSATPRLASDWGDHLVPSQDSAAAFPYSPPTARQKVVEGQETP